MGGIAKSLGFMSADAMLIHFAGEHAAESASAAEGAAREVGDQFRTGGRWGKAQPTRAEVVPDFRALSDAHLLRRRVRNKANVKGQQTTKEDIAREILMRQGRRQTEEALWRRATANARMLQRIRRSQRKRLPEPVAGAQPAPAEPSAPGQPELNPDTFLAGQEALPAREPGYHEAPLRETLFNGFPRLRAHRRHAKASKAVSNLPPKREWCCSITDLAGRAWRAPYRVRFP